MTLSKPGGYRYDRTELQVLKDMITAPTRHTYIAAGGAVIAEVIHAYDHHEHGHVPDTLLVSGSIPEIAVLHQGGCPTFDSVEDAVEAVLTAMCGPKVDP